MIYTSKDFDRMSLAELHSVTDRAIKEHILTASDQYKAGKIPDISTAWMNAERLQSLANTESDPDEAEALSREAAAARLTLAILFND